MPSQNSPYNRFSKAKLKGSKWTSHSPRFKEKHFIVQDWAVYQPGEKTEMIEIEAVLTRRVYEINYKQLKNKELWQMGWHSTRLPPG